MTIKNLFFVWSGIYFGRFLFLKHELSTPVSILPPTPSSNPVFVFLKVNILSYSILEFLWLKFVILHSYKNYQSIIFLSKYLIGNIGYLPFGSITNLHIIFFNGTLLRYPFLLMLIWSPIFLWHAAHMDRVWWQVLSLVKHYFALLFALGV